jgi:hypothetical protein
MAADRATIEAAQTCECDAPVKVLSLLTVTSRPSETPNHEGGRRCSKHDSKGLQDWSCLLPAVELEICQAKQGTGHVHKSYRCIAQVERREPTTPSSTETINQWELQILEVLVILSSPRSPFSISH